MANLSSWKSLALIAIAVITCIAVVEVANERTARNQAALQSASDPISIGFKDVPRLLSPPAQRLREEHIDLLVEEALLNSAYAPQVADPLSDEQRSLLSTVGAASETVLVIVGNSYCNACVVAAEYLHTTVVDNGATIDLVIIERHPEGAKQGSWPTPRVFSEYTFGPISPGVFGTVPSIRVIRSGIVEFAAYGSLISLEDTLDAALAVALHGSPDVQAHSTKSQAWPLHIGETPEVRLPVTPHAPASAQQAHLPLAPAPPLAALIVYDQLCDICRVVFDEMMAVIKTNLDKGVGIHTWVLFASNQETREAANVIASRYPWAQHYHSDPTTALPTSPLAQYWYRALTPDVLLFRHGEFFAGFHPILIRWAGLGPKEVDGTIGPAVLERLISCASTFEEEVTDC